MTDEQALDGAYPEFENDIFSIKRDVPSHGNVPICTERIRLTEFGTILISTDWNVAGYDDDSDFFEMSKAELLQLAHAIINEWGDE